MKKAFEILKWLMLVVVIVLLMAFSFKQQAKVKCQHFDVLLAASEDHFVNNEMIHELLKNKNLHPLERASAEIAIKEIEQSISNHAAVKNANVYSDILGKISVDITQRKPIARVVEENDSYYIDEDGQWMPLSNHYTARTLVISGNVAVVNSEALFQIAQYIYKDPFWNAQIMQVHIEDNEDLTLIPRVGYHQIVFGEVENFEEKFSNLKLFYEKGISYKGWNNYSSINLKFKNQIVCTKK
jgi:cell division protein FtsQ